MKKSSRRDFLKTSVSVAVSASVAAPGVGPAAEALPGPVAPAGPPRIKNGVLLGMLPKNLSYADRMKMARDVGFEGIQAYTTPDQREAEEIKKAADDAGIKIDSVMNMDHWKYPLSSADPAVVQKSLDGMKTSLNNAKLWGAYSVLLVPAVVNEETSYKEAWTRSQKVIRTLVPMAKQLGV